MMAFNNGFPATYPQMYYPPIQPTQVLPQQIQPQPQPAPAAYQATQSGIIWVGGEQEAQSYPVAPNNAVALWDSTRQTIYLKQADASGKPVIKTYDLVERAETARVSIPQQQGDRDTPYARKSDVETLSATVDDLRAEMETLRREMSRKPRRKEVIEDDE